MGLEYRQDGKFLSDAILTLPSEDLAKVLGLLEEIDLMSLMNSYAKNFMSSSKENLNQKLETRYQELSKEPVGGLVLRIFGSLNQILEIKPRRYTGEGDFEDNAAEIVSRTIAVLHSHEKFFTGQDLQALVRFQTVKLFEELGTKFENLSEEERHDLMEKIRRFVNELPIDQQERLKEDLHAEELSDPVIKNAIKSGALGTSFAAAVAATSIVASLTSVGVSLRFYGSLMSFMGVLSNPIVLFMIFAGGGLWLYEKNNRTLRERLAPHVVS